MATLLNYDHFFILVEFRGENLKFFPSASPIIINYDQFPIKFLHLASVSDKRLLKEMKVYCQALPP